MTHEPRRLTLHPSLIKPLLLAGGDRTLTGVLWISVIALVWGTKINLFTMAIGLTLGICGQFILVRAAKADALWWPIYLRSLRYTPFYRASSGVRARSAPVRPSVPKV